MPQHFADRLLQAIEEKKSPTCVGIDPDYGRLPADIASQPGLNDASRVDSALDAVLEFCRRIIHIVSPYVPAVKINSAFFERFYGEGVDGYYELVQEAAAQGLVVIGDCKRGDIGHSSAMYARAHLGDSEFSDRGDLVVPDAITVNPYFGWDGLKPFAEIARDEEKGIFILVQTSNPSAEQVQGLTLEGGMRVGERIGVMVNEWAGAPEFMGTRGYSCLGAVVSPRDTESTMKMRALMPNCIFLVPGFGAQGQSAEAVSHCFKADGTGALITASRSVIYAYEETKYLELYASEWEKCVEQACKDLVAAVGTPKAVPV